MDDRSVATAHSAVILQYYQSINDESIQNSFRNLDDASNLDGLMRAAQCSHSRNFVLDLGEDDAFVAFDLATLSVTALMDMERPEALSVRWINIWYPQHHKPLLDLLARRYDFSPRLLALMASDPGLAKRSPTVQQSPPPASHHRPWNTRAHSLSPVSDPEKALDELSVHSSISSHDAATEGNLYRIIDDLWHYTSVDFGRNYVCIGYNSLYGTKHAGEDQDEGGIDQGLLPHCARVWTWLLFCEDRTVISISEDPFPFAEGRLDAHQQRILTETRRNLVNVFRSLSIVAEDELMLNSPMTLLPIRTRLGSTPEESAHRESDAPGLLFYYLFENWHNSYTLVTRKESRYGVELNRLRTEMFEKPQLCHIDRLDSIGKELSVLRRHYQSYERIIDRLLEPQIATAASLQGSRIVSEAASRPASSLDTVRGPLLVTEKESMLGVSLTSASRARFKRLKDLIDLYALSEVDEYIKQKEALVAMVSLPHEQIHT